MSYFLLAWLLLLATCWIVGTATLASLQLRLSVPMQMRVMHPLPSLHFSRIRDRTIASLWLGLVVLAIALQAVALLLPLSLWVGGAVVLALVAAALRSPCNRAHLRVLWRMLRYGLRHGSLRQQLVLLGGLTVALSAFMSQPVTWLDTGLYHYGSIQWLATHGTVPGVALLFGHFGFGSSWFALAAPFSPTAFSDRVAAIANGFALLLAGISLFMCCVQCSRKTAQFSDWFLASYLILLLLTLLIYPLFTQILVSASPDLPVMLLVGITVWAMLVVLHPTSPAARLSGEQAVPLMMAVGAMTIKLVAIPLVVVGLLFYGAQGRVTWRRSLLGVSLLLLLSAPMLISNSITSGCPLFPSNLFCLSLPWSPSNTDLQNLATNTHGAIHWYSGDHLSVLSLVRGAWRWFNGERINQMIVLLGILTTVSLLYATQRFQLAYLRPHLWLAGTAVFSLGFLFITTPMARFTLPYVIILVGLLFATIVQQLGTASSRTPPPVGIQKPQGKYQVMLSGMQRPLAYLGRTQTMTSGAITLLSLLISLLVCLQTPSRLVLPPPMLRDPVVQKTVNDITYWSPFDPANGLKGLCWSAPLPCAFDVKPDVWLRQPSRGIAGGFVRY